MDKVIEIDPKYALGYINRGALNEQLNRMDSALNDYHQAILNEPLNGTFYRYRGVHYLSQQNITLAIEDLNNAILYSPSDGMAYFLRAKAYQQTGNKEQALSDALRSKELNYPVSDNFLNEINKN